MLRIKYLNVNYIFNIFIILYLIIYFINCRSLRCNIDIILRFITENDIYIAAFRETWLNDDDHYILSLLIQF